MMIIYFLIFILGASVGSFVSVYAERGNVSGRSMCVNCKKQLKAWELIPVFSYIFVLGKCSSCKATIPFRLFLNEMVLGVWFLFSYIYLSTIYQDIFLILTLSLLWFFGSIFLLLVLEDIKSMSVSSLFVNFLVIVSLAFAILKIIFVPDLDLFFNILLPMFIISPFWIIYLVNKNAIGEADPYVFSAIGLFFGSQFVLSTFLYSVWIGTIWGIIYLIFINKKFERGVRIPFLPIIFFSTLLILIFDYHILQIRDILLLNEIFFA